LLQPEMSKEMLVTDALENVLVSYINAVNGLLPQQQHVEIEMVFRLYLPEKEVVRMEKAETVVEYLSLLESGKMDLLSRVTTKILGQSKSVIGHIQWVEFYCPVSLEAQRSTARFMADLGYRGAVFASERKLGFLGSYILSQQEWLLFWSQCLSLDGNFVDRRYVGQCVSELSNFISFRGEAPLFSAVVPEIVEIVH